MNITYDELKPFQKKSCTGLNNMIEDYPSSKYLPVYNRYTGKIEPFVCRLKAITGAGKTPILACTASNIKDGIILWTTSRGAIITQTYNNLISGGKYSKLLPEGTKVFLLSEMSISDWKETMTSKSGLTILLATVASFNQDGDKLVIHRENLFGKLSRWQMLSKYMEGTECRNRHLYIFYDEGHGATAEQFKRLAELNPSSFILASASPFPDDLTYLLPGETVEEKENSLLARTVSIPTKSVVETGLLKSRIYFTECNTTDDNALKEAEDKYQVLNNKLKQYEMDPILCCIVNSTLRGVDVWESLVNLGVPKNKIAVHIDNAKDIAIDRYGSLNGLIDTYTGKKSTEKSPESLRNSGFTHIIWNLTLREGWDEPLAYVAYIDDYGRSETDMVQKIGRFIRQPNAKPFDDPDLNSAYFYFNVSDEQFTSLIKRTQEELELEGHEIINLNNKINIPSSREVTSKASYQIPKIYLLRGKPENNSNIVLKYIRLLDPSECIAEGSIKTRVYEVAKGENISLNKEEKRDSSGSIIVWDFISSRLQRVDSRIVNNYGNIFTHQLRTSPQMMQRVQWGSPAITLLESAIDNIVKELENELNLIDSGGIETYQVPSINLVNPNIKGVIESKELRYKVHKYNNSIHPEYNDMNPFEFTVAEALDKTGKVWFRNPSTSKGYNIPIPIYGADSSHFRPDFILWGEKTIWAIDPKGKHLLDTAVTTKMLDLSDLGIQIAFILEGSYSKNGNTWTKDGQTGMTLIRRYLGGARAKTFKNLDVLLSDLK